MQSPVPFDVADMCLPDPPARIHFVGVGGTGVSALARMLCRRGYQVTGSDTNVSPITEDLGREGVQVSIGHDAANVEGVDLVVRTAAARLDNPEVEAAVASGVPVVKRAALLGLLANDAICLAVSGSHGKSTTSGMAALALDRAGLDPSLAVGATVRELGTNGRLGAGPHFVVEADEYDYSFLWLRPTVAIVTNIEHDHPDLFPDLDAVLDAFERFVRGIRPGGSLVISARDAGCRQLIAQLGAQSNLRIVTFGEDAGDWRIDRQPNGLSHVIGPDGQMFALRLAVPGRHNLLNALAVLAASESLGVSPEDLVAGLEMFGGVSRRFEVLLDTPELTVVNDYAHHPTEVAATIAAARDRYPERRIVAIFQPHTYSRTKALLDEFADALDTADEVILASIYPARESDTLGVSSESIAQRMESPVLLVGSAEEGVAATRSRVQAGDVVLVMGAGDIFHTAEMIAADHAR